MAYAKINTMSEAISIGKKPGEKKSVEGYLTGAKYAVGKTKVKKGNTLFQFQSANGEKFDVWGNASIVGALTVEGRINPSYVGCMVKIEFDHMRDSGKGKNPQKVCNVFLDNSKKLNKQLAGKAVKDYTINK